MIAVGYIAYVQLEGIPSGQRLGDNNTLTIVSMGCLAVLMLFFIIKHWHKLLAINIQKTLPGGMRKETADLMYHSALHLERIAFGSMLLATVQFLVLINIQIEGPGSITMILITAGMFIWGIWAMITSK